MRPRLAVLALAGLATTACSTPPEGPLPMRVVAGNGTEARPTQVSEDVEFELQCCAM